MKDGSMSDAPLVLSLFPGIGLLDMAFEQEGFTVVRGPDLLWGGDVRRFHPPAGRFEGVIGGPPCQAHSQLKAMNPHVGRHGDQIPEYARCVREARPDWFVMENVVSAPAPDVAGYALERVVLNNRWLGAEQHRLRAFWFGHRDGHRLAPHLEVAALEAPRWAHAVLAGHGHSPSQRVRRGIAAYSLAEMCELQGLPAGYLDDCPLTKHGQRLVLGNGVPLPMGRAVARAVRRALPVPI